MAIEYRKLAGCETLPLTFDTCSVGLALLAPDVQVCIIGHGYSNEHINSTSPRAGFAARCILANLLRGILLNFWQSSSTDGLCCVGASPELKKHRVIKPLGLKVPQVKSPQQRNAVGKETRNGCFPSGFFPGNGWVVDPTCSYVLVHHVTTQKPPSEESLWLLKVLIANFVFPQPWPLVTREAALRSWRLFHEA